MQIIGGAFGVSAAQAAFGNILLKSLPSSIDSVTVIVTGATQLRSVFTSEELPAVLFAYMAGIKAAFAVAIGFSGLSLVVSLASNWEKLKTHAKPADGVA